MMRVMEATEAAMMEAAVGGGREEKTSGRSSEKVTQIMQPPAKPSPMGTKGAKAEANHQATRATTGWGIDVATE